MKMSWSNGFEFPLGFIYFLLTYVYVSCLILSSDDMYCTRPCYGVLSET